MKIKKETWTKNYAIPPKHTSDNLNTLCFLPQQCFGGSASKTKNKNKKKTSNRKHMEATIYPEINTLLKIMSVPSKPKKTRNVLKAFSEFKTKWRKHSHTWSIKTLMHCFKDGLTVTNVHNIMTYNNEIRCT